MSASNLTIGLTFDNTMIKQEFTELDEPVPTALNWVKTWITNGARIVLQTYRTGDDMADAIDYLTENGVMIHAVGGKCDLYVNAAAFGCPVITPKASDPYVDWTKVGTQVNNLVLAHRETYKNSTFEAADATLHQIGEIE